MTERLGTRTCEVLHNQLTKLAFTLLGLHVPSGEYYGASQNDIFLICSILVELDSLVRHLERVSVMLAPKDIDITRASWIATIEDLLFTTKVILDGSKSCSSNVLSATITYWLIKKCVTRRVLNCAKKFGAQLGELRLRLKPSRSSDHYCLNQRLRFKACPIISD